MEKVSEIIISGMWIIIILLSIWIVLFVVWKKKEHLNRIGITGVWSYSGH